MRITTEEVIQSCTYDASYSIASRQLNCGTLEKNTHGILYNEKTFYSSD